MGVNVYQMVTDRIIEQLNNGLNSVEQSEKAKNPKSLYFGRYKRLKI